MTENQFPAPVADETYYAKGKDAPWFEALSDADFAREACHMAQDINDTGLGDDLDKWMPFQAVISDAAARISRLAHPTALSGGDSGAVTDEMVRKARWAYEREITKAVDAGLSSESFDEARVTAIRAALIAALATAPEGAGGASS